MRKPDTFDFLALFLTIFYFILLLNVTDNRGALGWDEAARSMGGVVLIKFFSAGLSPNDFIQLLYTNHYYVFQGTILYGPLHAISSALTYMAFGYSPLTARFPAVIFGAFGILLTYLICRLMYNDGKKSLFASLIVLSSTIYFDFSTMNFSEIPILFSISLGTYFLFGIKNTNHSIPFGIVAGILFALAALTKPSAIVMAVPIIIYILVNKKTKNLLLIPLLIFISLVSTYWLYLKTTFHFQLYLNFWLGGGNYHPETDPFSLGVISEFWKPLLGMLPVTIVLLLIIGFCFTIRKPNSEEIYLLLWIAGYFFIMIASGAVAPHYALPALPAMAIIAFQSLKITEIRISILDSSLKKIAISAISSLIILASIQAFFVPVYKSISLQDGKAIKGESYNPLIIRTFLQFHAPSLYWINTTYYNGSSIDFYARNSLDEPKIDTVRILEQTIVQDIRNSSYQNATVILLSEKSNYLDFWLTVDDPILTYNLITLEPLAFSKYAFLDTAPKYLIISRENEEKYMTRHEARKSNLSHSVHKIYIKGRAIIMEELNIDK